MKRYSLLFLVLICASVLYGQRPVMPPCAQDAAMQQLLNRHPLLKTSFSQTEQRLRIAALNHQSLRGQSIVSLPVVIHIVHNNGPENLSLNQIMQALTWLNEAYADERIEFCLAQRDPANQSTGGITRDLSSYTNMSGAPTDDDAHVKNLNRWDPNHYINIWVVNSIPGPVAGYAYLPVAHGMNEDGLVVEAGYFGNTKENTAVLIHEMGHYLGLYHTFEGGCTNTDCSTDGDKVCDTPPDQSTAAIACGQSMNSCPTDALSGFSSDEPDLTKDYMDYGTLDCMNMFTQLQSDRMHWFIDNVRESLLGGNACQPPCPALVTAGFSAPPDPLTPGITNIFSNTSLNANNYKWSVDGNDKTSAADFSYTFPAAGTYLVTLVAVSSNPLCNDDSVGKTIRVICPADASFTPQTTTISQGGTVSFIAQTGTAASYQWTINGTVAGTNPSYQFSGASTGVYAITLVTGNGTCTVSKAGTITVIDPSDTCAAYSFRKTIGGTQSDNAWDVQTNAAGYFLLTGITRSFGAGASAGFVTMLQPSGKVDWSIALGDGATTRLHSGVFTADGGSIHAGINQSAGLGSACLIKLDATGQLQWAKQYNNGQNIGNVARAIQCSDGGYLISAGTVSGAGSLLYLLKTDATGMLVWSKSFAGFTVLQEAVSEGTNDYVVSVSNQPSAFVYRGTVFSVDKASGNFNWGRYYDVTGSSILTDQLRPYNNGWLLGALFQENVSRTLGHGMMLIKSDGSVDQTFRIRSAAQTSGGTLIAPVPIPAGSNFYLNEATAIAGDADAALIELGPSGQVLHAKQYQLPLPQLIFSMQGTADGGVVAAGYSQGGGSATDAWILKTDSALRSSCPDIDLTCIVEKPAVSATSFSAAALDLPLNVQDFAVSRTEIQPTITDACPDPALCRSLKINGRDTVCANVTVVFHVSRSEGCTQSLQWNSDPLVASIDVAGGDSVSIHFKKTGWLYASVAGKCKTIIDSMLVRVYQPPDAPNLGPDRSLCMQSSTTIVAGEGFADYKWQDGSTAPVLTAFFPGTYWVKATDGCGVVKTDTVILFASTAPGLDLPGAIEKCSANPVTIAAAGGFNSYSWSPAFALDNPYAQVIKTNTLRDTVYTCTATSYDGCTVVDSIHVIARDCINGIYFPNAFTPNGDGISDGFGAVIRGNPPVRFRLVVFNRMGQKLYATSNWSAKWDGTCNGKQQASGGFAWYCEYQYSGETEKKQQGVLMLIR